MPKEIDGSFIFLEPIEFDSSICYVTAARFLAMTGMDHLGASRLYQRAIAANLDYFEAQDGLLDLYRQHQHFEEAAKEMLNLALRLSEHEKFSRALWAIQKLNAVPDFLTHLKDEQIRDYRRCEMITHLALAKTELAAWKNRRLPVSTMPFPILTRLNSPPRQSPGLQSLKNAIAAFQKLDCSPEFDELFNRSFQLFEEAKYYQELVEAQLEVAKLYCLFSHWKFAEAHFIKAMNNVSRYSRHFNNSVELRIDILKTLLDSIPNCSVKAHALNQLGELFSAKKNDEQAFHYYDKARQSYEEKKTPAPNKLCKKLVNTALKLNDSTKVVYEYMYLGTAYANQKKNSKSDDCYVKGLIRLQTDMEGVTPLPPHLNENFSFNEPASFNTEPYYLIVAQACSKRSEGFDSAYAHYQRILKKNITNIAAQEGFCELLQRYAPEQKTAKDMFDLCHQLFESRLFARVVWAIEKIRMIPNHESHLGEEWRSFDRFAPLLALASESEIRISNMESQIRRYEPLIAIRDEECLSDLTRMKHLTKVDFSRCTQLTDNAFKALEQYDLIKLDLSSCTQISSELFANVIPRFQHLRTLRMRNCVQIQPEHLGSILEKCTNLDRLDLRGANQTSFLIKENSDDSDLTIPRFLYSAYKGDQTAVDIQLQSGVNIESKDRGGKTQPLFMQSLKGIYLSLKYASSKMQRYLTVFLSIRLF